jgi:sugar O-acyltransferase (sialic acid O-acetyltransferase NeuD family)
MSYNNQHNKQHTSNSVSLRTYPHNLYNPYSRCNSFINNKSNTTLYGPSPPVPPALVYPKLVTTNINFNIDFDKDFTIDFNEDDIENIAIVNDNIPIVNDVKIMSDVISNESNESLNNSENINSNPTDRLSNSCNSISLSILGAGGHAKTVLELLKTKNIDALLFSQPQNNIFTTINKVYIFDDDLNKAGKKFYGHTVFGSIEFCLSTWWTQQYMFCAIGCNKQRKNIVNKINTYFNEEQKEKELEWVKIIGHNSTIATTAKIGEGTLVLNGCNIGPDTQIGRHCIINNGANVDHDCILGDYVHIAPNATLCGGVQIGDGCLIGAGATIVPNIKIRAGVLVKAGSLVKHDIL